ncbi:hypothetical protein NP233_g10462 [Leucocoprinus birnbaumii]|uniref:Uncharacterized protein n=1 Tax=Leucocoprinus birnbaumii TaxID=56174 RepID=A0AAD5VIF2_9AGAR|nr:hypothetical protein NP233_g10462 [Leucocoprinus birnbaumii]
MIGDRRSSLIKVLSLLTTSNATNTKKLLMAPKSGHYRISCNNRYIGRAIHEHNDLTPKPILSSTDDEQFVWLLEKLFNGRYRVVTGLFPQCPTGIDPNDATGVVGFVAEISQALEWELRPVHGSEDTYNIVAPNGAFWVVPRKESTQIQVLNVPEGSVFHFTSVPPPKRTW